MTIVIINRGVVLREKSAEEPPLIVVKDLDFLILATTSRVASGLELNLLVNVVELQTPAKAVLMATASCHVVG